MRTYRILLQILGILFILVGIGLYKLFSFVGTFALVVLIICTIPGIFFLLLPIHLKRALERDMQRLASLHGQPSSQLRNRSASTSTEASSSNVSTSSSRVPIDRPVETTTGFSNLTQNPLHSNNQSRSNSSLPDWLRNAPDQQPTETHTPTVTAPTSRVVHNLPEVNSSASSNLVPNSTGSNNESRSTNSIPDWLQDLPAQRPPRTNPSRNTDNLPDQLTSSQQPGPDDIKPFGPYPGQKDGHPLQYSYNRPFTKIPGIDIRADVLVDREREVDVQANGDLIELVFNGKVIGTISDSSKAQMVSDWKRKGFPCSAIVLRSCVEVVLRFYRDKRIGNEHRQQNVFALTAYKSDDKQDTILCLSPGDELDLEEDWDHEDSVIVLGIGEPIGKLPKKYATKYLNEGAYCVYFEKYEEVDDEYNYIVKPFIRIYW